MGVSEKVIEASWSALADSLQYKLMQDQVVVEVERGEVATA